ncbi:MAG: radical SAM protein [Thermoanaerobaculales bacterium]|nr:radical SAM protein [Thermoanaerobaculales bacterium]
MQYEFPNIKLLDHLQLEVEDQEGRLAARTRGLSSPLFSWAFNRFFDIYNTIGPVSTIGASNVYTLYVPPIPSPMHARHTEAFLRRWLFRTRVPLAVTIGVTDRCQCRCVHCSAVFAGAPITPMTVAEIQRVVSESVALGATNITFTGGEPLLREDLEEVVATVPRDKAVSLVFSNGIGLTPERARSLKEAGLWGVQLSLDSPDPEEHDRLRVWPGCFDSVRSGVAAARDAGLLVGLSTYATNEFVESGFLGRIAGLGAEWGANELTVFDAIPTGRLRNQDGLLLTPDNRERLIREGLELRDRYRAQMHVVTQSWTNSGAGFARFVGCLAGHYQFHIKADGSFRPCDFTPLTIGNVRDASVHELWHQLTTHPAYRKHHKKCRMQCAAFREKYLVTATEQNPG